MKTRLLFAKNKVMETILLYDILKENDYATSGTIVHDIAYEAILNDDLIVIDMEGIESVPTTFMNTSFGTLMNNFGVDKIKKSFRFRNILKTQVERISKYFYDYESLLNSTGS